MLLFLDETFRANTRTGAKFAALSGVGIPESIFPDFLEGFWSMRRPYHGEVLDPEEEVKGKVLLNRSVLDNREEKGHSAKWSMAEDLLNDARKRGVRVFGVVTFDSRWTSLDCKDELALHESFKKLFTRVDRYMKLEHPGEFVKIVFDSRQDKENERNSRAITNFLVRSTLGISFDSIVKVPFFGVSQAHNYGLQLADLVTTVIGLRFAGEERIKPLWRIVQHMLYRTALGDRPISSLALLKQPKTINLEPDKPKGPGDR
jgi:hypothetical protein